MLDANHYLASYNKAENDIAEDFYLPSMRASCKYDRISGYFGTCSNVQSEPLENQKQYSWDFFVRP